MWKKRVTCSHETPALELKHSRAVFCLSFKHTFIVINCKTTPMSALHALFPVHTSSPSISFYTHPFHFQDDLYCCSVKKTTQSSPNLTFWDCVKKCCSLSHDIEKYRWTRPYAPNLHLHLLQTPSVLHIPHKHTSCQQMWRDCGVTLQRRGSPTCCTGWRRLLKRPRMYSVENIKLSQIRAGQLPYKMGKSLHFSTAFTTAA